MNKIFYGKQNISNLEIQKVCDSLKTDLITRGNFVSKFENSLANFTKSKYSLSVSSGTAALDCALNSINLKPGDNIIIPVINFTALANLLLNYKKINVYFADVNEFTGQVTPVSIENCIKKNKLKKVKAFFTMYLGGSCIDINNFIKLKKKYKCYFIEDACHAFGSKYKLKKTFYNVGCARHSDISLFSFHPVKTITTGEGGAITTNNKTIYQNCKLYRSHGIVRKKKYWKYDVLKKGVNFRMSDINAAIGIVQLQRINSFLEKRRNLAKIYLKEFYQNNYIHIINNTDIQNSSLHLFLVLIDFKRLKITRDKLIQKLNKVGIFPQVHYIPHYEYSLFKKLKKKDYKNAVKYYEKCLTLPLHFNLKKNDIIKISQNLKTLIKKNKR